MDIKNEPKLREAAIDRYSHEWSGAIDQALELARTFDRLVEAMKSMSDRGCHIVLVFDDGLTQAWWSAYRESHGDMVPSNPELPPRLMLHEDAIVTGITKGSKA